MQRGSRAVKVRMVHWAPLRWSQDNCVPITLAKPFNNHQRPFYSPLRDKF